MKRIIRFRSVDKGIFLNIKNKEKTVETRAATVKYCDISKGDTLIFVCGKDRNES